MTRPYQQIDSTPQAIFDALHFATWLVIMRSSVTAPNIRNVIPGVLYVFVMQQDAAGGHTFVWPSNCLNGIPINPTANTTTVQCFIGLQNNLLNANIPATN
jgi:hypothetical protein